MRARVSWFLQVFKNNRKVRTPICNESGRTLAIPTNNPQMFVEDGDVLPKSSANQLVTLRMIDVKKCQHMIGNLAAEHRSYGVCE